MLVSFKQSAPYKSSHGQKEMHPFGPHHGPALAKGKEYGITRPCKLTLTLRPNT